MRNGFRNSVDKINVPVFLDIESEFFEIRNDSLEIFTFLTRHIQFERNQQRLLTFDVEIFDDSVVQNPLVSGVLIDEVNKISALADDVSIENSSILAEVYTVYISK